MTHSPRLRANPLVRPLVGALALGVMMVFLPGLASSGDDQTQLPTTNEDFYGPGTQPEPDYTLFRPILMSFDCRSCHSQFDVESAPYDSWVTSMMAQSARDPIWHAALAVANQDASGGGETCIRCHAPRAWLAGKSFDGLIDDFDDDDFDGVNCNLCHRAVNPDSSNSATGYPDSGDPDPDPPILDALLYAGHETAHVGNGTLIVDPADMRRGPYDDIWSDFYNVHGTDGYGEFVWLVNSPYHRESSLCGECHDVSNPLYLRNPKTGELVLTPHDEPHPSLEPHEMFAEQRTYSEWLVSDFADGGVEFDDNRFGGAHPTGIIESCQDCHMPKQVGAGCAFLHGVYNRPDIGQHSFAGANTWVIDAVREQMGEDADLLGITEERVQAAKARTIQMLKDASDMELSIDSSNMLNVRIINQTGHKLPTGYPEGRRMWINVRYYDENEELIEESGAYDYTTATLDVDGAKIYQMRSGISRAVATAVNLPVGESFHLTLNNVVLFDNRIPPRGAKNEELDLVRASPVGYSYDDDQYWDDTLYDVPTDARSVVASLYFQTTTREYIEFLRNTAQDGTGSTAFQLWTNHGESAPVTMDVQVMEISPALPGDINGDGIVNGFDLAIVLGFWGTSDPKADLNGDGVVNGADLAIVLGYWTT